MFHNNNRKLDYFFLFLLCSIPVFYSILFAAWYKAQFTGVFHFFDDSQEWLGMDKGGHYITAFVESWICIEWYKLIYPKETLKFNIQNSKFILFGFAGFFLQLPIEFMDGYSQGYGFSFYDCIANLAGSLTALVQFMVWGRILIFPKVSFFPSEYAAIRPNLLGSNLIEQFIKDYNALTYWYSFSPNLLLGRKLFPSWLNIAIGYSADGLLGGHDNIWTDANANIHDHSNIPRVCYFYLSLDINVLELPWKNKYLRWSLGIFNVVKIPIPVINYW